MSACGRLAGESCASNTAANGTHCECAAIGATDPAADHRQKALCATHVCTQGVWYARAQALFQPGALSAHAPLHSLASRGLPSCVGITLRRPQMGRQALGPRRWGRPRVRRGRSARWACWRRAWAVRRRQAPRRAPRSLCSPGCWPRRPRLSGGRARPRWPPCARCRCACGGGLAVRGVGVDGVCGDPGAAGTLGGHACARTPLAVTLLGAPDSLVSARPLKSSSAAALSGGVGSAGLLSEACFLGQLVELMAWPTRGGARYTDVQSAARPPRLPRSAASGARRDRAAAPGTARSGGSARWRPRSRSTRRSWRPTCARCRGCCGARWPPRQAPTRPPRPLLRSAPQDALADAARCSTRAQSCRVAGLQEVQEVVLMIQKRPAPLSPPPQAPCNAFMCFVRTCCTPTEA